MQQLLLLSFPVPFGRMIGDRQTMPVQLSDGPDATTVFARRKLLESLPHFHHLVFKFVIPILPLRHRILARHPRIDVRKRHHPRIVFFVGGGGTFRRSRPVDDL